MLQISEPVASEAHVSSSEVSLADLAIAIDAHSKHPTYRTAYRQWTSADGKSRVFAKLCDVGASNVTLLKADGNVVRVEQDRLLAYDMEYVAELLAFIENGGGDAEPAELPAEFEGKVVAVTDGDTIGVLHDGREVKIRLGAIDAPERGQPFGSNSKQALSNAVFGKQVTIKVTGKDRYGRSLGWVVINGKEVNAAMVRAGYAWHFAKYNSDKSIAAAELAARIAGKGLWALESPIAPWDWRKGVREPVVAVE